MLFDSLTLGVGCGVWTPEISLCTITSNSDKVNLSESYSGYSNSFGLTGREFAFASVRRVRVLRLLPASVQRSTVDSVSFGAGAAVQQQMLSKKRRRQEAPATHPRNRYAEKPPDFGLLASLYPSFQPFVFISRGGRPAIQWTDFNATRELTRVLLHHDHGVQWWIPDGQLCPTVPNRSNYIHWIGDLMASDVVPKRDCGSDGMVRGFDIGTGANCIYPLLGASLYGWSFVGSDITDVALEWAKKNVENNPHLSHLIDIRSANAESFSDEVGMQSEEIVNAEDRETELLDGGAAGLSSVDRCYHGPPVLVGVVREGEEFDFCMCNPPFFESIGEAGLNPKTSCGGTHQEMVCPGGERAFILRIIEDSVVLKCQFRWFTSMIGRKANLKLLVSKLREVGVSIVKTTEFVQGQTARWGLAWSFMPPNRKSITLHPSEKSNYTFMLEVSTKQLLLMGPFFSTLVSFFRHIYQAYISYKLHISTRYSHSSLLAESYVIFFKLFYYIIYISVYECKMPYIFILYIKKS